MSTPSEMKFPPVFFERLKRYEDTVALRPTDRVLISPQISALPLNLYKDSGKTFQDALEDRTQVYSLFERFYEEYQPDLAYGPNSLIPSKVMDIAGCDYVRFPGRDFDDPDKHFQVLNNEYMTSDEYHDYILDPTGFMMKKVLPRHYRNLPGLAMIDFSNPIYLGALYNMIPFSLPPVQQALGVMAEAGKEMLRLAQADGQYYAHMMELGFPSAIDFSLSCPFDMFNDTLRGIQGVSKDMRKCPDLFEKALDTATKLSLNSIRHAYEGPHPPKTITFFLHNGMDTWMSVENFERFYWPGLLACAKLIIELGGIPKLYFEGDIEKKLDIIAGTLPKGKAIVNLIDTDLKVAKQKLGKVCCLAGGINGSLLMYGTPKDVEHDVKSVLDIMAPGGGYYLDTDIDLDFGKPENLEVLFKTAKEYGRY